MRVKKNYLAMTEFRREVARRGFNVNDKVVVDFRSKPGKISIYSYPPPLWSHNMRTISFRHLEDNEYKSYIQMRDHYRKHGGLKIKEWDHNEQRAVTKSLLPTAKDVASELSKSGFIIP